MQIIYIATKNKNKINEFKEILKNKYKVKSLLDVDETIEIIEDGNTFEENAIKKAQTLSKILNAPVISDDSGISVRALNNKPSIHSKRFAHELATDEENNIHLLSEMSDKEDRYAFYTCVIAYVFNDEIHTFKGILEGEIATTQHIENGFGYDSLFKLNNEYISKLTNKEKSKISHRSLATRKLIDFFEEKEVIKKFTEITNIEVKTIEKIKKGRSNKKFLINDDLVYRLDISENLVYLDRFEEQVTINNIKKLDITNELIYQNIDQGIKIYKYIKGDDLLDIEPNYKELVDVLKKLHSSSVYFTFNVINTIKKYDRNNNHSNEYSELRKYLMERKHILKIENSVLCHNDLERENIIQNKDGIKLIDIEMAANNDVLYDIASFGSKDIKDSLKLASYYFDSVDKKMVIKILTYRLAQCLLFYNIASNKDDKGLSAEFNVNFKQIANKYLKEAQKIKNNLENDIEIYLLEANAF